MKIVVLDGYTLNPGDLTWDGLDALGTLTVYDRTPADEIISRIGDAEIVFTNKTPITKETLDACPQIRFIGVLATGYNIVDTAAAAANHIPVANIPTYGTSAVAQFTFALLLEICHHVGHHSNSVREGAWTKSIDFCYWDYPLMELAGKTIGLLGFGKIGQAVANIAHAFSLQVLAYDISIPAEAPENVTFVDLDTLLARSDILSLHCPLFPSTEKIINAQSLKKMKDSAILINTSRGPLIDEQAVADALQSGKLAAAAMDVVSTEPIRGDNPLLQAKNCLITPHIAWAPKEARVRLMNIAVNNLKSFLEGAPIHIVNL